MVRDTGGACGAGRALCVGVVCLLRRTFGGKSGQDILGSLEVCSRDRENQLGPSAARDRFDHGGDARTFQCFGEGSNLRRPTLADGDPIFRILFCVQGALTSSSPVF